MSHDYDVDDSPLEVGHVPKSQVSIDPEMIRAIAMGLEDPGMVAARYGFEGERWAKLQEWPPFLLTIAKQKAEFEASGVTFRNKTSLMADQLADQVFVQAMGHETTLAQKMNVLQYFAKMGELEPKESKQQAQGEGFSISINIGGQSMELKGTPPASKPTTLEMVEDATPASTPGAPAYAPLVDPSFLRELQNQEAQ